jgi:guanine deaminase
MLRTADEAYKVCQLNGESVNAAQLLYAMTLGSATTLGLDTRVGDFSVGKDADFIAVDLEATPLMQLRMEEAKSIEEKLFALMVLGDDRCVRATHIMGNKVYDRDECRAAS